MRILTVFALSSLVLAACGGPDAPESLGRADNSTTIAGPTTAAPTTAAEIELTMPSDPANLELSEEELATLSIVLNTPEGRKLVADGIVAETEMTSEQASCFVEEVELASILSLAGDSTLIGDTKSDVIDAFASCDIDIAIFQGL